MVSCLLSFCVFIFSECILWLLAVVLCPMVELVFLNEDLLSSWVTLMRLRNILELIILSLMYINK